MDSPDATRPKKSSSFDPPEEPVWHRMIAETAYSLAEKRGFAGEHALDDWLAAEQQVRKTLSPNLDAEATMNATQEPDLADAIAREALEEVRRKEEALRYRSNPGPIVAPEMPMVASGGL